MTKAETKALLEAVKNAPIVNNQITVTVFGTTFTFGCPYKQFNGDRRITEENRKEWIALIERSCKKRFTSSVTKRELDTPGLRSQNRIVAKMLIERVKPQKKSKNTEDFYFVLNGMEYVQQKDFATACEYAKSIGKKRSDVFKVKA